MSITTATTHSTGLTDTQIQGVLTCPEDPLCYCEGANVENFRLLKQTTNSSLEQFCMCGNNGVLFLGGFLPTIATVHNHPQWRECQQYLPSLYF